MQSSLFEDSNVATESLDVVNAEMLEKCRLRYSNRIFILGTGPEDANIVIVGESPGPPDVATGKPFSGPSGDLLERIVAAIGVDIKDCFLTNVVKFISRGEEIGKDDIVFFSQFVQREILSVSPRVVILLGNTAARGVLGKSTPISQLRGQAFDFHGITTIPTFNPAYVLRDPTKKREVWEDMKLVRDCLNHYRGR